MTRDEALLKLLAVEPERLDRLILVTGWQAEETRDVLRRLMADGRVTFRNGFKGQTGGRTYYPVTAA